MTTKEKKQLERILWELKLGTPIVQIAKKEKLSRIGLAYRVLTLLRKEQVSALQDD